MGRSSFFFRKCVRRWLAECRFDRVRRGDRVSKTVVIDRVNESYEESKMDKRE